MAFTGLHVLCAVSGDQSPGNGDKAEILGAPFWSRTMASANTTDVGAPKDGVIFRVRAAAASWFAIGQTPDASQASGSGQSAREYIEAGEVIDRNVAAGDKLAWILA
ncbi:hypothetical protein [Rhizobium sp. Leaf386]|uniref:hypothetical protein n=1 Tax=Rhizobium sp. Leaf386 TaxID=1736359 RepID=UPI0007133082|nr:hypothetical protein [Rhizobium sp. Leaf386]KQS90280.1 hypothetical protein ASG50_07425 [Rhizobium sp. Leaf386]